MASLDRKAEGDKKGREEAPPRRATGLLFYGKRILINLVVIALGFVLVTGGALFLFQRKIMYYPQRYQPTYRLGVPEELVELEYETSEGSQVAFYLPPAEEGLTRPKWLWVLFHGNAGTALDWLEELQSFPDRGTGFLLVDYPGYGLNTGKPTREGIIDSGRQAYAALSAHLDAAGQEPPEHLGAMGFSMGSAAAAEFAVRFPVDRLILLAPFTSIVDIGKSVYGPFGHLARDRFDTRQRLAELADSPDPPQVHIFHGTIDSIVPARMGRELAAGQPVISTYHGIEGAEHHTLTAIAQEEIFRVMRGEEASD